jgi:hypothetical protein
VIFNREEFEQKLDTFSYAAGVGKKIKSGPVHEDPWEDESSPVVYAPVIGSILMSSLSLILVFSILKS